jgi:hypothetical protein
VGGTDERYYTDLLTPMFRGRPVIVTGGPVAGLVGLARQVRRLGARRIFVLGSEGRGAGALPTAGEAEWMALEVSASTMLDGVRAGRRVLEDLPPVALDAVDRFDPGCEALVVATFLNELPAVAGRPCLGYRRPEWVALEDKVIADRLWDRAAVARAPTAVVPAERAALVAAAATLDQGLGTVWAADAREGYHGGAQGLRWVRDDQHVAEAVAFLAARADRVRVMPFLEGVPCSIHGLVFDDHVAALRPVEMVTLRTTTGSELVYAGAASYWDPPPGDREVMRESARRVGDVLREEVGFRGPFTVDGVLSADGFLPTELNPRSGAGLRTLAGGLTDLPLEMLTTAIAAGLPLDFRPVELERMIVAGADARRGGGTWRVVRQPVADVVGRPLRSDGDGYHWAGEAGQAEGWVTSGSSPVGGFVRMTFDPMRTPVGPSVAERAVAFWRFADASMDTRMGPLAAARTVR